MTPKNNSIGPERREGSIHPLDYLPNQPLPTDSILFKIMLSRLDNSSPMPENLHVNFLSEEDQAVLRNTDASNIPQWAKDVIDEDRDFQEKPRGLL